MNGTAHASANGVGGGHTDLLGLGTDYQFMSPERQALLNAPADSQHVGVAVSLVDDEPMNIEMRDADLRQGANCEQARSTLDFHNPVPRPIRAHRSRRNRNRSSYQYPQNDHYAPGYSKYRDLDDTRGRAFPYERQTRQPSPETLFNTAGVTIVTAMAELDVREERDDRRDGDRYRGGGNNKRRRDGKLATERPQVLRETDSCRRQRQLFPR
jgi:hypothetical protein